MPSPLTADQANAIYDLLVQHAGASENGREGFVIVQANTVTNEYRFGGLLGFGGKFWRMTGLRREDRDLRWSVNFYSEDKTSEREAAAEVTNRALAGLLAMQGQETAQ